MEIIKKMHIFGYILSETNFSQLHCIEIFVGFERNSIGKWVDVFGREVTADFWEDGFPFGNVEFTCTGIFDSKLQNVACDSQNYIVCELPLIV